MQEEGLSGWKEWIASVSPSVYLLTAIIIVVQVCTTLLSIAIIAFLGAEKVAGAAVSYIIVTMIVSWLFYLIYRLAGDKPIDL